MLEISVIKKIIENTRHEHSKFIDRAKVARRYYQNQNDITLKKSPSNRNQDEESKNPLRKADNRVSNNFHQMLVDQKAAYIFTNPPLFDVDDKELNQEIVDILGDMYPKVAKDLSIDASNCEVGWLHVWIDDSGAFKYCLVDPAQIIPIYSKTLDRRLVGILRVYEDVDDDGKEFTVYEYWTGKECHVYRDPKERNAMLQAFDIFNLPTGEPTHIYTHDWAEHDKIPFIPFWNNNKKASDLNMYKGLNDVYDKVYNGFVNDVEDVQEVIFVIRGYGGTEEDQFMKHLQKFKALSLDDAETGAGIDTLTVEIPIEARNTLLELTRKRIFESGQGVDPFDDRVGNASGSALKFKYSLLEMKSGLMETEFRLGFAELIRFILLYLGKNPDDFKNIKQTWARTAVNNDLEQAQVINYLAAVTSKENTAKSNPIVEDWEAELELLKREGQDEMRMEDDYLPEDNPESEDLDDEPSEKRGLMKRLLDRFTR